VRKILIFLIALSSPALAQDDEVVVDFPLREDVITVVATGSEQRLDWSGQPVAVVGRAEIETIQGPDLTRVLERLPGVTVSRNGGIGGFTAASLRGANAEQVLVLVDGVRAADVAAPAGGTDLGNLLAGEVERIDLLRGANSVVWGSDALAGVIAVTTRDVDGLAASAEYGANDSLTGDLAAGGRIGALSGTLDGGYSRTDGVSAAAAGTEPDGFRQWRIGGKARLAFGRFALVANARTADGRLEIDGYPPPAFTFADTPEYQTTRQSSGRLGAEYAGDTLELRAGYALSDTRRAYFDPRQSDDPNYRTWGSSRRANFSGRVGERVTLDFGADSEWTRFHTSTDAERRARLASVHALAGWHPEGANLAAGVRYDDHSRFGGAWTLGANGSVELGHGWRAVASYGEGFKAPTLVQLLSDYGNAALTPERSRSFDAGVELGDRNAPLHIAAHAFRRDTRDLIDFVSCFGTGAGICANRPFGTYDNVGRARARGFEIEGGARIGARLHAAAVYSFVDAVDRGSGRALARRPRHALTASLDWTGPRGLVLGGDVRLVGDSFDDAANLVPLDGYALVDVRASLPVSETFELYGRIENLTDADYVEVAGYNTRGRAAFVGARLRL
jgi:vitamin B12 transporter